MRASCYIKHDNNDNREELNCSMSLKLIVGYTIILLNHDVDMH